MNFFNKLYNKLISSIYSNRSFSQEGEDQILERIFENQKNGFYIDIGAHHPIKFSNTFRFYLRGWNGINIDAMPGSMKLFNAIRKRDTNLEIAISKTNTNSIYYQFNEPALNTFSKIEAEKKDGLSNYQIINKIELKTCTLAEILSTNLKNNIDIDFLTIDVEGLDFEVLESNNWGLYIPKYILVEELNISYDILNLNSKTKDFLYNKGYILYARTVNTSIYKFNKNQ
jgi:FkbM family methyltransferase